MTVTPQAIKQLNNCWDYVKRHNNYNANHYHQCIISCIQLGIQYAHKQYGVCQNMNLKINVKTP